jgi:hypothetical protein
MGKIRVPLDIDERLKQDFIDRVDSHFGYDSKVKLNTLLQDLMHYVIFADELELQHILSRGSMEKKGYSYYNHNFDNAENDGLFEGLDIKRGNPRKAEIGYYLQQYLAFPDSKDEVREKLKEIDGKMKTRELYEEDCSNYMNRSAKVLRTYGNYMNGDTIVKK